MGKQRRRRRWVVDQECTVNNLRPLVNKKNLGVIGLTNKIKRECRKIGDSLVNYNYVQHKENLVYVAWQSMEDKADNTTASFNKKTSKEKF